MISHASRLPAPLRRSRGQPRLTAVWALLHVCVPRSEYSNGSWMLKGETVEPLDKTPLAVAVAEGHLEAATLLLDAGAPNHGV